MPAKQKNNTLQLPILLKTIYILSVIFTHLLITRLRSRKPATVIQFHIRHSQKLLRKFAWKYHILFLNKLPLYTARHRVRQGPVRGCSVTVQGHVVELAVTL